MALAVARSEYGAAQLAVGDQAGSAEEGFACASARFFSEDIGRSLDGAPRFFLPRFVLFRGSKGKLDDLVASVMLESSKARR